MSGRMHETDEEISEFSESESSSSTASRSKKRPRIQVKNQKYRNAYTEKWPFLTSSTKGVTFVYCKVCERHFSCKSGGNNDCKKHVDSKTHGDNQKASSSSTGAKNQRIMQFMVSKPRQEPDNDIEMQRTRAEVAMCQMIAKWNLPLSTADHLTPMFQRMFPDSKIAKGFQCCRDKATAVIKEMSALAMGNLASRMKRLPFSIATDGSNDADKKQFPIVITIQGHDGLVNAELLSLSVCKDSATGQNIFDVVNREFEIHNIPWDNCLAFGCDNAYVMTGDNKGVYAFVKEKQENVHLARCCLHLIHLSAKKGAACLPPVEDVLVDVYYYFQKSVKRQSELKDLQHFYDAEQRKMLKHVCTRWLSIARCLERLMANWKPLLHFFRDEKKKQEDTMAKKKLQAKKKKERCEKQSTDKITEQPKEAQESAETHSYATKKVDFLYEFLRSPTNTLYCHFLAYTVKVYDQVLVRLQAEEPMICTLHESLVSLIRDLYARFLVPSAVTGKAVKEVQYQLRANQKDDADLIIGRQAREMIRHPDVHRLRSQRVEEFYSSVRLYFEKVVGYLLTKLPLQDHVLLNAVVADPKKQLHAHVSNLEDFLEQFPILIPAGSSVDELVEQFIKYQMTDITDCETKDKKDHDVCRVDKVWAEVEQKHPELKELSQAMRGILTIPHSSAACERIFSQVRKTCTEQRTSMLQETSEALLVVKNRPGGSNCLLKADLQACKSAYYKHLKKK